MTKWRERNETFHRFPDVHLCTPQLPGSICVITLEHTEPCCAHGTLSFTEFKLFIEKSPFLSCLHGHPQCDPMETGFIGLHLLQFIYSNISGLQAIPRYHSSAHFPVHHCTRTRVLSFHEPYPGNGFITVSL
jgi:hypothetical protein